MHLDPFRMVEILATEGVRISAEDFQGHELGARRILHDGIAEGGSGTEPELWSRYFLRLFGACGVPEERIPRLGERVREAHEIEHLWTFPLPGTGALLARLRNDGYRVGVISNADGRMEGVLNSAGLREHLEFVIDSGVVGVEKPDPDIFRMGCETLQLRPESCLYVGDLHPVDYVGARGAGLAAVLLDPGGHHRGRAETLSTLDQLPAWLSGASW